MDELYRGYRISIKQTEGWVARVTHVRGPYVALNARSSLEEGAHVCLERARGLIDRYIAFLSRNGPDADAS